MAFATVGGKPSTPSRANPSPAMTFVIDAHLHCTGQERISDVLQTLDDAEIDIGVLLAPFLSDGFSLDDPASLVRANSHLAALVKGHGDRLVGLGVVNPLAPGAVAEVQRAIDAGLSGLKMVPSGWYPYDDAVQPVFAEASALRLPVLFHSGIFIDGRSGRFCRPTFFEAMRAHPGVARDVGASGLALDRRSHRGGTDRPHSRRARWTGGVPLRPVVRPAAAISPRGAAAGRSMCLGQACCSTQAIAFCRAAAPKSANARAGLPTCSTSWTWMPPRAMPSGAAQPPPGSAAICLRCGSLRLRGHAGRQRWMKARRCR